MAVVLVLTLAVVWVVVGVAMRPLDRLAEQVELIKITPAT